MHGLIQSIYYYFICYFSQQIQKRAAKRDKSQLWPGGKVYYRFDATINSDFEAFIRQAISTLEKLICVQFIERPNSSVRDYITFRSKSDDGCSSHIGYAGGEQIIKIGPRCSRQHTILHEICHALGLWHEQSRPDRDDYLEILSNNIESGREHNFLKRNTFEVDSQGESYDYASVMHYRLDSFNTVDPLNTLKITNQKEYIKQGKPELGRVPTLSKSDVTQLNRLYNCPGSGVPGKLTVKIEMAKNLPSRDDPYVLVTAYDDNGNSETQTTNYLLDEGNPVWNTKLRFGKRTNWQYIDVSVWDHDEPSTRDPYPDDQLTANQSFSVNQGRKTLVHCKDIDCHMNMTFSMAVSKMCHCLNNGICEKRTRKCNCPPSFGGSYCQYPRGQLNITALKAINLINEDGSTGASDVFLVVQAHDHNGGITEKRTRVIRNNLNPTWNEKLVFDINEWSWFTLQAFDDDSDGTERLSSAYTYILKSFESRNRQTLKALGDGIVHFGYNFN